MTSLKSAHHTVLIIGPVEEEGGHSLLTRLRWRWQQMKDFAGAALLLRDRTTRLVISSIFRTEAGKTSWTWPMACPARRP